MSPEQQLVSSFMQEAGDPLVGRTSDTVVVKFIAEEAIVHMIKGICKVHNGDICLFSFAEA